MSRNLSRITLGLVACLLGAAFVYGQSGIGQFHVQNTPLEAGAGRGNFFFAQSAAIDPHTGMHRLTQEEHDLARQADEVTRQLGDAENTGDRDKLKTQLRELLGKQFDVQKQRREEEIEQIEERVRKLREQLKKRSDARQTIIDRRLEQITSDAEGLGWTPLNGDGPFGGISSGFFGRGGSSRGAPMRLVAPQPIPATASPPTAPRAGAAPAVPSAEPRISR